MVGNPYDSSRMPVVIKIDELEKIRAQISPEDANLSSSSPSSSSPSPLHSRQRNRIPNIIHQIVVPTIYDDNENEIPEQFQRSKECWINHHPSHIYVQWTPNMIKIVVARYYPFFIRQYNGYSTRKQLEQVAPTLLLHRYGGIYSHSDLRPTCNLSHLFNGTEDIYVPITDRFKLIASPPNSYFWSFFWKNHMMVDITHPTVPSLDWAIDNYPGTIGNLPIIHGMIDEENTDSCDEIVPNGLVAIILILIVVIIIIAILTILMYGSSNDGYQSYVTSDVTSNVYGCQS